MSNGVGVLQALTGSLPRVGSSRLPDADDRVRSPGPSRSSDTVRVRKSRASGSSARVSARPLAPPAPARGLRPTPTGMSVKATAATPSPKTPPLTPTALRRIADAGAAAQARGASFVRLTLRPAHLGTLLIELAMRGAVLHGRIRTETPAARDLILSQVNRLREALEARGIRVGDFQVQVERPPRRPDEDDRSAGKGGTSGAEEGVRVGSVRRHVLDVLA